MSRRPPLPPELAKKIILSAFVYDNAVDAFLERHGLGFPELASLTTWNRGGVSPRMPLITDELPVFCWLLCKVTGALTSLDRSGNRIEGWTAIAKALER